MIDSIIKIDTVITLFIDAHITNPFVLHFFNFFTLLGYAGIIWILIIGLTAFLNKDKKLALYGIFSFLAICIISEWGLKNIFSRPRPFMELEGLSMLAKQLDSFSFPSGHTALSAGAALILTKEKAKPSAFIYIVLAVLISISRLILKVHYLSDVIGGAIVGALLSLVVIKVVDRILLQRS